MRAQETEQEIRWNRRGGSGVDSLRLKYFSAPNQKQKKTRMAQIPSLRLGDVERVTGVLEWTQQEVCPYAFQNLCLTLCVCASQPSTTEKKKIPPPNSRQSAPLT